MTPVLNRFVHRSDVELRGDPRRVVAQLFIPGQETLIEGDSRATAVIDRALAMNEDEVEHALRRVRRAFANRYDDLDGILGRHFQVVAHRFRGGPAISENQRLLIGAYLTREYSIESAALFNPSIVEHPDQSGLSAGECRFIMSVRGVGEGHISSIGFREGIVGVDGMVIMTQHGTSMWLGYEAPFLYRRDTFFRQLAELGGAGETETFALGLLPERFSAAQLEDALTDIAAHEMLHEHVDQAISRLRMIARCNYAVEFPDRTAIPERVLWPNSPTESHGLEDARFVRFIDDDGEVTYFGSYTAFDGKHVVPQMIHTTDFRRFHVEQLSGQAAKNKGLAVFPRRIDGHFAALSRWNRESNDLAMSDDGLHWTTTTTVQMPERAWEIVQLGNCGSPIETVEGWLVLTHGVGPMREYSIGAMLLDRDDPSVVLGVLPEPILTPDSSEREGYVPNVVYSCGGMVTDDVLVLPYGCSDSRIRIATVDVPELLGALSEV